MTDVSTPEVSTGQLQALYQSVLILMKYMPDIKLYASETSEHKVQVRAINKDKWLAVAWRWSEAKRAWVDIDVDPENHDGLQTLSHDAFQALYKLRQKIFDMEKRDHA